MARSGARTYAVGVPEEQHLTGENEPRVLPELKPVPPWHPMFHGGVGFVTQHELPEDESFGQAARFLDRLRSHVVDEDDERGKSES